MSAAAVPAPVFETDTGHETTEANAMEISRSQSQPSIDYKQIAEHAYALWQERGCRDGFAEQDWLDAEQQLLHDVQKR